MSSATDWRVLTSGMGTCAPSARFIDWSSTSRQLWVEISQISREYLRMTRASDSPCMLLRFRGENIRSFRNEFEISFVASTLAEPGVARTVAWRDGDSDRSRMKVLPAAVILGANGSGKTNVLRAMYDMRECVLRSFRGWGQTSTSRRSFRLDRAAQRHPSLFEVDLILGGVLHRYGFTLDDDAIVSEWALRFPHGREQVMFERERSEIKIGSSMPSSLNAATELVRENALFLSTAVALRGSSLRPLFEWFVRNLILAEADTRALRQAFTVDQLNDESRRAQVLDLLRAADLGIVDVQSVKPDPKAQEKLERVAEILFEGEDPERVEEFTAVIDGLIRLKHRGAEADVYLNMGDESLGTLVWLGLIGPIVDALTSGSVLLADELDASLHPRLVAEVVRLFQDQSSNPRRAQIVFNSHDVSLLGDSGPDRLIGRDQIWFCEKDGDGASKLYPLSDLDPRKNEAIARRYLSGRYGAVPILAPSEFAAVTRDLVPVE